MDWLNVTSLVAAALLGAAALFAAEILFIVWYLRSGPSAETPPARDETKYDKYTMPQTSSKDGQPSLELPTSTSEALSHALQFLFQQLRHESRVRRWLQRKLSTELAELLTRSTPGRLFESLTLRDLDLGTEFVEINTLRLERKDYEEGGQRLRGLDFRLDVAYVGSFRLDVDAAMLLGKTARISIIVSHIKGPVRLSFTREPYTHWALAFIGTPDIGLDVTGSFQGRQLRPRLAHLITAQIKRAIARRHTLPNYKIRYKPFFVKIDPGQTEIIPDEAKSIKPKGKFQVTLVEVTRLHTGTVGSECRRVYCTVALDSYSWVSCRDHDSQTCILTLDIVITKSNNRALGIVFKQTMSYDKNLRNLMNKVVIETVLPLSAAYRADLRRGDVIIAVDAKKVNNMNHVAKLIKGVAASQHSFVIRVERSVRKSSAQDNDVREDKSDASLENRSFLDVGGDGKRSKSNSFSFRRVSEVMEGVGIQRLRGSPIKSDPQDSDAKSTTSIQPSTSTQSIPSATAEDTKSKLSDSSQLKQPSPSISFSKHADSIQIPFVGFGLRKRRCSVENKTSSDSSTGSTPTTSSPSTPLRKANSKDSTASREPTGRETRACSVESIQLSDADRNSPPRTADDVNSVAPSDNHKPQPCAEKDATDHKMTIQSDEDMDGTRAAYEHVDILQIHNSKMANLDSIISMNDSKMFKLCENHKYLNINVWAKVGADDETLLGYVNIPLVTILSECRNSKLGHHIKQYSLLPPDVALTISKSHPLTSHSGFEPCLCYGDILVSFIWTDEPTMSNWCAKDGDVRNGSQETLLNVNASDAMSADGLKDTCEDITVVDGRKHDFIRTHFQRSTQCDFCGKKIWLKDAVQCCSCSMCCHKKCVQKCQAATVCVLGRESATVSAKDDCTSPSEALVPSNQPEILVAEHFDIADEGLDGLGTESGDELDRKSSIEISRDEGPNVVSGGMGGLLAAMGGSLRRVGSAHSLAPPRSRSPAPPRSLPPSPCHTPRKQSLASPTNPPNPFDVLPRLLEDPSHSQCRGDSLDFLLQPLVQSDASADALLAMARDTGKLLYAHLLPEDRNRKILDLMSDVRETLASQSAEQAELSMALTNSHLGARERSELSLRMARCEGRGRALTALMLYCCAAAQNAAVAAE